MAAPRILGIDYGEKRIGLALSDPLGITAQPIGVIEYTFVSYLIREIISVVNEKSVNEVVVGLPKKMNNTVGKKAEEVLAFAEALKAELGGRVEVNLMDERLTTVQAAKLIKDVKMNRSRKRAHLNAVSAQILLQTWMDIRKNKR